MNTNIQKMRDANFGNVKFQILSVQCSGKSAESIPRIQFSGSWLAELGFVKDVLVQVLPKPDELVISLYNDNIIDYSELYRSTKEKNGVLMQISFSPTKMPLFTTVGNRILNSGFNIGDMLIAKCEYGRIRIRKVSGDTRLIEVSGVQKACSDGLMSRVWLWGDWLRDIGFLPDTLVTVKIEPDCITLAVQDKAVIYSDVVRFARKNKMRLVQVVERKGEPLINTRGACISDAGFLPGDMFSAECEHGIIKLQKLDPEKFGF